MCTLHIVMNLKKHLACMQIYTLHTHTQTLHMQIYTPHKTHHKPTTHRQTHCTYRYRRTIHYTHCICRYTHTCAHIAHTHNAHTHNAHTHTPHVYSMRGGMGAFTVKECGCCWWQAVKQIQLPHMYIERLCFRVGGVHRCH